MQKYIELQFLSISNFTDDFSQFFYYLTCAYHKLNNSNTQ